jgi:hypothetical protein
MGNGLWVTYALFAALAVVPAILNSWQPWEIIVLVVPLTGASAVAAWAWAWHAARVREAELAALSSDEQAARLLGEALGRCGAFLNDAAAKEIWDAFTNLPSESKRALTLAITGFLADREGYETYGFSNKILAIVRGFRDPSTVAPAITTDEQAARTFGESLGRCVRHLSPKIAQELWDMFAVLPGEGKRGLASAVVGFVSSADLDHGGDIGKHLLGLASAFQLTPEPSPAHAVTP